MNEQMFRAMFAGNGDPSDGARPQLAPEIQIARLKEYAALHAEADKGPRFTIGAIVAPRSDAAVKGTRQPHIVVATRQADYDFTNHGDPSETASNNYGNRRDIRVLSLRSDMVVAHWVESADFEIYQA